MLNLMYSRIAAVRRSSAALRRDTGGVTAVIVAITVPVIVGFAALAIDMSYAYWTRSQLQHTASAAALAGVSQIGNTDPSADIVIAVKAEAVQFAVLNMDPTLHGNTLDPDDVILGNWNPAVGIIPGTFTPTGDTIDGLIGTACLYPANSTDFVDPDSSCLPLDAVEVTTRRAVENENPLDLFLGGAVALAQTDINTLAVAWAAAAPPPPADTDCFQEGMIAGGTVIIQDNNEFTNGYCIYGECQVVMSQGNGFESTHQLEIGGELQWIDGIIDLPIRLSFFNVACVTVMM